MADKNNINLGNEHNEKTIGQTETDHDGACIVEEYSQDYSQDALTSDEQEQFNKGVHNMLTCMDKLARCLSDSETEMHAIGEPKRKAAEKIRELHGGRDEL